MGLIIYTVGTNLCSAYPALPAAPVCSCAGFDNITASDRSLSFLYFYSTYKKNLWRVPSSEI
jgi:hypothetical protein